jgi:hypothetical protein
MRHDFSDSSANGNGETYYYEYGFCREALSACPRKRVCALAYFALSLE